MAFPVAGSRAEDLTDRQAGRAGRMGLCGRTLIRLAMIAALMAGFGVDAQSPVRAQEIVIGVLLDQSGTRMSQDRGIEAALRVAVQEINTHFSEAGEPWRFSLKVGDTRSEPDHALLQLQAMAQDAVRIVIGPTSSQDVFRVKAYAATQGILLISPSSTAPSLAVPGDLIFRMVPDDTHQGKALAERMWRDGIRAVVPIRRDDLYAQDLVDHTKRAFESRDLSFYTSDPDDVSNCKLPKPDDPDDEFGGNELRIQVCEGVVYSPSTSDFISEIQSLADILAGAVQAYGARRVAVLLIAFDEAVPVFLQAAETPILSLVRWYGADGTAKVASIVNHPGAARFAARTSFTASLFAEARNGAFEAFSQSTERAYGVTPDANAAAAYDALWLIARAIEAGGAGQDPASIGQALARVAQDYIGASGPVKLNAAGDRDSDDFDFWRVRERSGSYEWFRER